MKRTRKALHIDFAPLSTLGFLLIAFFVVLKVYSMPNVVDIVYLRDRGCHIDSDDEFLGCNMSPPNLNLVLLPDNQVFILPDDLQMGICPDTISIKTELPTICHYVDRYKAWLQQSWGDTKKPVVFILPTEHCNYQTFVATYDLCSSIPAIRFNFADISELDSLKMYNSLNQKEW